jgi:hypothetical protein
MLWTIIGGLVLLQLGVTTLIGKEHMSLTTNPFELIQKPAYTSVLMASNQRNLSSPYELHDS